VEAASAAQLVAAPANNMPPRRNTQPPYTPDEEPLPAMDNGMTLDQLNAMNGVNMTEEDAMASGMAPQDVVNDVAAEPEVRRAEPNLRPTGAFMDLGFIQQLNNAASDEEFNAMYDALDPALKHVYDRSYGMQISPKWAAETAQQYYQMQDKLSMPQNRLAEQELSEKQTAKLNERRDTMRTAQIMLDAADRIDKAVAEGLVGPWKDVEQRFDGSGMPFSDPDQFAERKALEVQTKRSVIDVLPAFKGPLSDSDRRFFTEMFPEIKEPTGVWKDYSKQLREKFRPIAEGNFELPSGDQAQGGAKTAAAPARNTFVYDGATYERLPDGTARLIE
jgi:hypothetical protein